MENRSTPYFYDQQIRSIILQFMNAFSWLTVNIGVHNGESRFASVPVTYGYKDRVAAAILAGNTHNKPIRAPSIAVHLESMDLAREWLKGYGTELSRTVLPVGGSFPEDLRSEVSAMPTPYKFNFSLSALTSNLDQKFQITEQILGLFQNTYTIVVQTTDKIAPRKIASITLESIAADDTFPPGQERKLLLQTFKFQALAYLSTPTKEVNNVIQTIITRIATVDNIDVDLDDVVMDIDSYSPDTTIQHDVKDQF